MAVISVYTFFLFVQLFQRGNRVSLLVIQVSLKGSPLVRRVAKAGIRRVYPSWSRRIFLVKTPIEYSTFNVNGRSVLALPHNDNHSVLDIEGFCYPLLTELLSRPVIPAS